MLPVIYALAQNDLPVHRNPCLVKSPYLFKGIPGKPVVKHHTAKIRLCRVDRYIYRGQSVFDDLFQMLFFEISKRDIVALQKGQSRIIILKVYGVSHPRSILIYETEYAFVGARAVIIHKTVVKHKADIVIHILFYAYVKRLVRLMSSQV